MAIQDLDVKKMREKKLHLTASLILRVFNVTCRRGKYIYFANYSQLAFSKLFSASNDLCIAGTKWTTAYTIVIWVCGSICVHKNTHSTVLIQVLFGEVQKSRF